MNDRSTKWGPHLRAGAILAALCVATGAGAAAPTDMRIRVTSTSSFSNGKKGTYMVTASNRGAAATDADIHVTDVLPDGFSFFSGTGRGWQCSAAGQTVDCVRSAALRAGSASSVRLKVAVCTGAIALTNSISVVYPADTDPTNNTVAGTTDIRPGLSCGVATATPTVTASGPAGTATAATTGTSTRTPTASGPTPTPTATSSTPAASTDLQIAKTINQPFATGSDSVYTLTVANVGAATTNAAITVTDLLPSGLLFVSAAGTGWLCSHTGQAVTCTTSDPLAPAASTSITLTVFVSEAAYPTVTNTGTLSYDGDTNSANNIAHRPTTIRQGGSPAPSTATPIAGTPTPSNTPTATPAMATATDLQLVKATGSTFTVGSNGLYLLTVNNLGAASTDNTITVVDSLPSGLTFVSAAGSGWSCSAVGQSVTCIHTSALAPGASTTCSLVVSVADDAYPTLTNTAILMYAGDTNSSNNVANRPTTIRP